MRIAAFLLTLAAAACGDDLDPDRPEPAVPTDPGPETYDPVDLPPEASGEYVIKVSPTTFRCASSGDQPLASFYAVADVVPQGDPWTFDLKSELAGTFAEFDRTDLKRDGDGAFDHRWEGYASFLEFLLTVKRDIEGSVDGDALAFFHRFDVGWDDEAGTYHRECLYEADVHGTRLHEPWDGSDKDGVSGQWWVTRTVLADPRLDAAELPSVRKDVVRTLSQAPDDGMVDLLGLYRDIPYAYRDPLTGEIDAWMLTASAYLGSDGSVRTMLQETRLTGIVLPTRIELEETWRWWTAATETLPEEEHWFQHERYEGAPRYRPHDRSEPEPVHGAYVARFELIENDCGFGAYATNRLVDVLPADDGLVWPRLTGFDREPLVAPAADGSFSAPFTRTTWGGIYDYAIDGALDGHGLSATIRVTKRDAETGAYACSATYEVAGEKLYMTARP